MKFDLSSILWIVFLLLALIPFAKQRQVMGNRLNALRKIERLRNSRVITLIHRQESISFLGIPFRRFIDMEDSEQVLRAIRLTPKDMAIDIILHTPGGMVLAAEQIARALKRHPARVTAIIPQYAMSGGTMIALAADEIMLDENAVLGPIDPQIGQYPASSIIRVLKEKPLELIDDQTIMMADIAEKAALQVIHTATEILSPRLAEEEAHKLAHLLSEGHWTHDYALVCSSLGELGLSVSCDVPREVFDLMALYPQPSRQAPAVEYIPLPYRQGRA